MYQLFITYTYNTYNFSRSKRVFSFVLMTVVNEKHNSYRHDVTYGTTRLRASSERSIFEFL